MEIKEKIEEIIKQQPVLMFIKGNKMFPRCGFSKAAVDIFDHPGIKPALVEITDWPTTPQVFLGGEFVGGGDIVRQLHAQGELKAMVDKVLPDTVS